MAENDFLQQLIKMMDERLARVENKIDANTSLTQKALDTARHVDGRVDRAEKDIVALQKQAGKRPPIQLSPNVIYLIALGAVILLAVVAALLKVDLGGLLK